MQNEQERIRKQVCITKIHVTLRRYGTMILFFSLHIKNHHEIVNNKCNCNIDSCEIWRF